MALKFSENSVNLSEVSFLVADSSDLYRDLLRRLLYGFGAKKVHEAEDVPTARRLIVERNADFMICAMDLPGAGERSSGNGVELVRSIRLDTKHTQRSIPIFLTMGTARRTSVGQARDSGANFVIAKPLAPVVLYDRINWVARKPRAFWESPTFYGPDRRVRDDAYDGTPKRRTSDKAPGATDGR